MSRTVACACGEIIPVPESAAADVTCPKCSQRVALSRAADETPATHSAAPLRIAGVSPASPSPTADVPPAYTRVVDGSGNEFWKLTCYCGQRIRSPVAANKQYGHCPSCGRRMRLPGQIASGKPFLISAEPGKGPLAAPSKASIPVAQKTAVPAATPGEPGAGAAEAPRPESHSVLMPAESGDDDPQTGAVTRAGDDAIAALAGDDPKWSKDDSRRISLTAAATAADRLRPQHGASAEDSYGRISAWPLAGKVSRLLAGFIDVTLAVTLAGIVVVLAGNDVLPRVFLAKEVVAGILLLAGLLNDGVIHLLAGGSLGKRLVVIVTRTVAGEPLGAAHIFVRAALKWILLPGWIVAAVDPSERTLHDLLCGTLVLKGRPRRR